MELASLPKPLPISSLGRSLPGRLSSPNKSRTVLLYSNRVRRRTGADCARQSCGFTSSSLKAWRIKPATLRAQSPVHRSPLTGMVLEILLISTDAEAQVEHSDLINDGKTPLPSPEAP